MRVLVPLLIGITIGVLLYAKVGWWGFLIVFPWIGLSITVGVLLSEWLPAQRRDLSRKIAILMISPIFLIFIPFVNKENLQLEGVVLLLSVGFFSKGVIHYAVAKVFGPLIWGRGFCGWACWTAAILDWLPIMGKSQIPAGLRRLRYLTLSISVLIPLLVVMLLSYNVKQDYLGKSELTWMITGNILYYLTAIPLAFYFRDKRAFCKIACPVSLIMKAPASLSLITVQPTGKKCIQCGNCNRNCPMDVDVMGFIQEGRRVRNTECILCRKCRHVCPVNAIK